MTRITSFSNFESAGHLSHGNYFLWRMEDAARQGLGAFFLEQSFNYSCGSGVEVDSKKSFDFCLKAVVEKHPLANGELGHRYRDGNGVEQNIHEAIFNYEIGLNNKDPFSSQAMAILSLYEGEPLRARSYYLKCIKWIDIIIDDMVDILVEINESKNYNKYVDRRFYIKKLDFYRSNKFDYEVDLKNIDTIIKFNNKNNKTSDFMKAFIDLGYELPPINEEQFFNYIKHRDQAKALTPNPERNTSPSQEMPFGEKPPSQKELKDETGTTAPVFAKTAAKSKPNRTATRFDIRMSNQLFQEIHAAARLAGVEATVWMNSTLENYLQNYPDQIPPPFRTQKADTHSCVSVPSELAERIEEAVSQSGLKRSAWLKSVFHFTLKQSVLLPQAQYDPE